MGASRREAILFSSVIDGELLRLSNRPALSGTFPFWENCPASRTDLDMICTAFATQTMTFNVDDHFHLDDCQHKCHYTRKGG